MTEPHSSPYVDKPIGELVSDLNRTRETGSRSNQHEEIKGALAVVLVTQLVEVIDRHEKAASRLANQVLILNVIFGLFTIAGTVWALFELFR